MKRRKLLLNALLLTLSTMTLGFINTGFRVYLSNKIGAEGMGLYQIIMSIHIVGSTIAISGIRVTTTRLVAEELGKGNTSKIGSILKKGTLYSLFFSCLASFIFFNSAEFMGNNWIHDTRAIIPIKILSCCLPFIGMSSCLCGYFYGMRKVIKSVTADIIETIAMMLVIIVPLSAFLPKGLNYTCILIAIAMSVGNMVGAFCSYILYLSERKSLRKNSNTINSSSSNYKLFDIAVVSLPIAFSAYVQTSLKTVEDILIPNALRQFGSSNAASLAIFGMIKGMVMPILYFPSIFLASFSTLIIPEIAEANALHKKKMVNYIISKVFKFTLLISIFSTGIFMIFSNELGLKLYNNTQVGVLMRILAPLIPLMYLDRVVDGSLNALNQQMSTLRYNLIDMSVRIFVILFLIPKKGIEGFIMVLFISTILNSSLSINRLLKVTKLPFQFSDWVLKPILCIGFSGIFTKHMFSIFNLSSLFITQLVCVFILNFTLLMIFKCIRKKDIMWFVYGFKKEVKTVEFNNINIYKQF